MSVYVQISVQYTKYLVYVLFTQPNKYILALVYAIYILTALPPSTLPLFYFYRRHIILVHKTQKHAIQLYMRNVPPFSLFLGLLVPSCGTSLSLTLSPSLSLSQSSSLSLSPHISRSLYRSRSLPGFLYMFRSPVNKLKRMEAHTTQIVQLKCMFPMLYIIHTAAPPSIAYQYTTYIHSIRPVCFKFYNDVIAHCDIQHAFSVWYSPEEKKIK